MICEVLRGLTIRHVVVFTKDEGIFTLAQEDSTGKIQLFVIISGEEKVYKRDARFNRWNMLGRNELCYLLQQICQAVNSGLPVMKIEGKVDSLINVNN